MKTKFIILAFTVAMAASWYAVAATDYSRIKKDVSVMSKIVKSAFEADRSCKRCNVRVEGKYLADQGILFLVNSSFSSYSWLHATDSDHGFSFSFNDGDLLDFEFIPEMVGEIVTSILPVIPDFIGISDAPVVNRTRIVKIVDDSTRIALREIRRERRDLQQEIRENEIELIHLDDDKINGIEASIEDMKEAVRKLKNKQQEIEEKARATRDEYTREREEHRMKRRAHNKQQQLLVQNTVLQAFCDYGSTLRSLPDKEKVTIIFENTNRETRQDTVLVFDQASITNCNRDSETLRSQAISYLF
ncbi:MAG: hypothetical protein IIB71_16180 [Proteobacteria bacterium]|nr:hypothetical protein [Pseudomonadota bacterium]